MKTVLVSINAKYIHTNNAVRLLKANSSFDIDILEYTIKDSINDIVDTLNQSSYDIIGFSVYIWNVNMVLDILKDLHHQERTIILGGPEVSYDCEFFLQQSNVDFIIRGEGEIVFDKLLYSLSNNTSYFNLPSLAYKDNQEIIINDIEEIKDLSILALPYFFKEDIKHIPNRISYIESSRGCPYKCSYCLSSLEKTVRFFPVDKVKESILYLMKHQSKTIKFLDRTFNANKHTLELLQFIIENDNNYTVFQFEITGDILDPKIITYLNNNARKGLFRFEIGIQSTNNLTNKLVDRIQNKERLFQNILMIEEGNIIDCHLDLIAGLPKENKESFMMTFNEVFKLGSKELQLGFLKMLRGTKIRNESALYNYTYSSNAPYEIKKNDVLNEEDINEIHLVEHMLEIYHNKGYFNKNMHRILLEKENPYQFFLQIGKDYQKNNYPMHHYQIEDVYHHLFPHLTEKEQYMVLIDYLRRSKIKPKIFFRNDITKQERTIVIEQISNLYHLEKNTLYKHSTLIKYQNEYTLALYQNNQSTIYNIKADI
jgi:radical SAM superfamily enzyme YgiQ (UPF0313 family)